VQEQSPHSDQALITQSLSPAQFWVLQGLIFLSTPITGVPHSVASFSTSLLRQVKPPPHF
jgi:hypothetical protein